MHTEDAKYDIKGCVDVCHGIILMSRMADVFVELIWDEYTELG